MSKAKRLSERKFTLYLLFTWAVMVASVYLLAYISYITWEPHWPESNVVWQSKLYKSPPEIKTPEVLVIATAYCTCPICCGKWSKYGLTASGVEPEQGITIAADTRLFPFGTCIAFEGIGERIVQDRGKDIQLWRVDVFFHKHEEAMKFGKQILQGAFCD